MAPRNNTAPRPLLRDHRHALFMAEQQRRAPYLEQADAVVDVRLAEAELPEDGAEHHRRPQVGHNLLRQWPPTILSVTLDCNIDILITTDRAATRTCDILKAFFYRDRRHPFSTT